MELTGTSLVDEVGEVLATVLQLGDRRLAPDEPLLGAVPELDSMAVVELVVALEERFGVSLADEDLTEDAFRTVADLAAFVAGHRG